MARTLFAGTVAALAFFVTANAEAQSNQNTLQGQQFARWRVQDKCIADATRQFPDRDLASLQSRDSAIDTCLTNHGMPLREHMAPSPPASAPAPEATTPPKPQ
jgi:hypothetical protein